MSSPWAHIKLLLFHYRGSCCEPTFGKQLFQFQLHWFTIGNVCDVGANALLLRTEVQTFVEVCKWCVPQQNLYTAPITFFLFFFLPFLNLGCAYVWCRLRSKTIVIKKQSRLNREGSRATREKKKTGCLANGCLGKQKNTPLSYRQNPPVYWGKIGRKPKQKKKKRAITSGTKYSALSEIN